MTSMTKQMRHAVPLIVLAGLMFGVTNSFTSSAIVFAQASSPSWSFTGSLNTARSGYTATLLSNGKVLVAGGGNNTGVLSTSELYDPSTGTWSFTGNLNFPRIFHTATLLQNGKVLVAGGWANTCCLGLPDNTAELYDPATGLWSMTGSLNALRVGHTATLLSNGKVLFAGGGLGGAFSATNTAELYNPETETWSFTGNLNGTRVGHTATRLQDGKILVVGGCGDEECFFIAGSAELYDPNTGGWSVTGSPNTSRYNHTATLLPNGNLLIAGGAGPFSLDSAELYNPATGQWSFTGSLVNRPQSLTATLLPGDQVLVLGGDLVFGNDNTHHVFNIAQLYDPATGRWNTTASPNQPGFNSSATLLFNGKVLVVGGWDRPDNVRSAELYDSGSSTINPIDDPQFFVRQHYRDFLNREPDSAGLAFWINEITLCGGNTQCVDAKRVNVSAAFFLSIEFQQSGYLVYRFYKSAFGNLPGAPIPVSFSDFLPDAQRIGHGVIVNQPGWQTVLENNKEAYALTFVQRSPFTSLYLTSMSPAAFVDTLFANAGVIPTSEDRAAAINKFGGASTTADVAARSRALLRVAENSTLAQQEFNRAFVLMQYFGYLRRNPNDAPDGNFDGYNFWLNKLNQFNGNFIEAEMVKAFLSSIEYRSRFGP